jgi:hypothetical protein
MRRTLTAALLLLTAACQTPDALDGYRLERADYDHAEMVVTFVDYPNRWTFEKAKRLNLPYGRVDTTLAFSALDPRSNRCTIHMLTPTKRYRPELVGHEIMHCRFGNFHS